MRKSAYATICSLLALAGCAGTPDGPARSATAEPAAELRHVTTLQGSPVPEDLRQPHMPGVDLLSDMDALFAKARLHTADVESGSTLAAGARQAIIVTPGRIMLPLPVFEPQHATVDLVQHAASILGTTEPLNIAVIGYTKLEALRDASGQLTVASASQAIPFLGHLIAFAYAGHSIVVFEGHRSAFEAGVRGADVLLVDSAMLPFLQPDGPAVAYRVMSPKARIIVHDRATYTLREWVRPAAGR